MPRQTRITDIHCKNYKECMRCITTTARNGYCSVGCWNKLTKRKPIDGYKKCLLCDKKFPFRLSLKVRSAYSKELGCMVGSVKQKYCSRRCSLLYKNKYNNPAQSTMGRMKIAKFAKTRGTAHLRTPEALKKLSATLRGKGHWNWQGGKTSESKLRRNDRYFKEWRKKVFERDDYTCQNCGARNGLGKTVKLNAHHIKPWSLYPDERFELSNGQTLCLSCHKETDSYMGRIKNYKK